MRLPHRLLYVRLFGLRRWLEMERGRYADGRLPKPPEIVYFVINNVCNYKCVMCDIGVANKESTFYRNLNTGLENQLSFEEVTQLVKESAGFARIFHVNSTEPLLYRRIVEVVGLAKRLGLAVHLTTNGYLLSQYAEGLVDAGLDLLHMSIDGPREIHNQVRGVRDAWERGFEGFRKLRELRERRGVVGPKLSTPFTITHYNYAAIEEFADAVFEEGADSASVSHLNFVTAEMAQRQNAGYPHYLATATSLSTEDIGKIDVHEAHRQLDRVKARYGERFHVSPDLSLEEMVRFYEKPNEAFERLHCAAMINYLQVLANGDVMPMTRCGDIRFGNIRDSSLLDIWNNERVREFRKLILNRVQMPMCQRCGACFPLFKATGR